MFTIKQSYITPSVEVLVVRLQQNVLQASGQFSSKGTETMDVEEEETF